MRGSLFFFLLLLSLNSGAQQTWQWAKSGGSGSLSTNNIFETIFDIACDKWGNTYVTGRAYQFGMQVDGHNHSGFGYADIIIASFSCDGSYRWSKVLGADVGDYACGLAVDTLGGVYVSFSLFITDGLPYTGHIDNDTSLTNINKSMMLVKFDTLGSYQWLRMPQPDSTSSTTIANVRVLGLDVSEGGDIYWLCKLIPASYADGTYIATSSGIYILRYNAQGLWQGAFQLDMNATGMALIGFKFKKDHSNGRLYVGGNIPFTATVTIGGSNIANSMYAAAFNSQGQHLWTQQSAINGNSGFYARPAIDDSGYVYFGGISSHGDAFAGYNVVNILSSFSSALPFIIKLDSLGNLKWANNASVYDGTYCYGLTANEHEVVVAGTYGSMLKWNGYAGPHPTHMTGQGGDIFLTRFNKYTGAVIKNDTMASGNGTDEFPTALATASDGGVIVGGQFPGTLFAGVADTLYMMGGETDFFVAKYGYPCGCVPPASDFNYSGTSWTVSFSYAGTGQYDSLRWYFGDGSTSTQTNPVHTYSSGGNYTVCVTAYNLCDSSQHCENIQVTVGVHAVAGVDDISVYPNPTKELLHLKGLMETTSYRLLTVTGAVMQQGVLPPKNNGISTAELAPGMYLLELNNKQQQGVVRVRK